MPTIRSSEIPSRPRNPWRVIQDQALEPIRRECADVLRSRTARVTKTEEELRQMTECEEFPQGLNFSTDDFSDRQNLYEMRVQIQRDFGIYFRGVGRRMGLEFTIDPALGMEWRVDEFAPCITMAQQLEEMSDNAIGQVGSGQRLDMKTIKKQAAAMVLAMDNAFAEARSAAHRAFESYRMRKAS